MHCFNHRILLQSNLKHTVNVNRESHSSIENNMRHNAKRPAETAPDGLRKSSELAQNAKREICYCDLSFYFFAEC